MVRTLLLALGLLFAFRGISWAGVHVGGGGGAGTGAWRLTTPLTTCGAPSRVTEESGSIQGLDAELHLLADLPEPRKTSAKERPVRARLGGAFGLVLTTAREEAAFFSLNETNGSYRLTGTYEGTRTFVRRWGGVRLLVESPVVDVQFTLGTTFVSADSIAQLRPAVDYRVRVGVPGIVGYLGTGRWLSGPDFEPHFGTETRFSHGVQWFGGDVPSFSVSLVLVPWARGLALTPRVGLGFRSPGHWRVQPWIEGDIDPGIQPWTRWTLRAGVYVALGPQRVLGVRPGRPLEAQVTSPPQRYLQ